ncbi:MAG: hypothetical protein M0026_09330 [Nocardiopsaceae bacterium]|nr:hypothetical protein [Nocardiopsaceae bacterium]
MSIRPFPSHLACAHAVSAVWAVLAVLAAVAVLFGLAPGVAADTSPAQRIADGLRQSPVYVDPAVESALPQAEQERLDRLIEQSGKPIYVVLVPLVAGDSWDGDPHQLLGSVHDRLGEDGSYLTSDLGSSPRLIGVDYGGDQQADDAASAANIDASDSGPAGEFARAIELIGAGTAAAEHDRLSAELAAEEREDDTSPSPAPTGALAGGIFSPWALAGGAAVLAALAGTGLLLYRRRTPAAPQIVAFDNADDARREALHGEIGRDLVELGERLGAFSLDDGAEAQVGADYQRALDAHHAAGKVLDAADDIADLAGAQVLLHMSEDALRSAEARSEDREQVPEPRRHCYFNPLHSTTTQAITWRALGSPRKIKVPACDECAAAVRRHRAPTALPTTYGGRRLAYYEVPAQESLWAATGYGGIRDDLVERVLRGDLRRG